MNVEVQKGAGVELLADAGCVQVRFSDLTISVSPGGLEITFHNDDDDPTIWFELSDLKDLAAGRARLVR